MTNEEFLTHLGTELKVARIRKRLSQQQLGELTGLSEQSIGSVEKGKKDCHILTYKRISDALGVQMKEVI